jgi:hypothetical protein
MVPAGTEEPRHKLLPTKQTQNLYLTPSYLPDSVFEKVIAMVGRLNTFHHVIFHDGLSLGAREIIMNFPACLGAWAISTRQSVGAL